VKQYYKGTKGDSSSLPQVQYFDYTTQALILINSLKWMWFGAIWWVMLFGQSSRTTIMGVCLARNVNAVGTDQGTYFQDNAFTQFRQEPF